MRLGFAAYQKHREEKKKAKQCNKAMCIKRDDSHFSAATNLLGARIFADGMSATGVLVDSLA